MAGAYERKSAPWQFWEKERPVIHSMKLAISSLCQIAVMGLWGKENTINSPNSMYSIYIHRNKINAIFATRSGDTVRFSPSPRALWWAPLRPDENGLQPSPGSGVPAEGGRWQGRPVASGREINLPGLCSLSKRVALPPVPYFFLFIHFNCYQLFLLDVRIRSSVQHFHTFFLPFCVNVNVPLHLALLFRSRGHGKEGKNIQYNVIIRKTIMKIFHKH